MPPLFPAAFRLLLICFALLGGAGLPGPVAAATTAVRATVTQADSGKRTPAALLAQSEALGQQAVAPRGPVLPLAGSPLSGFRSLSLAWEQAAGLAARATPLVRPGDLPNYFRARLLRAALSPHAP